MFLDSVSTNDRTDIFRDRRKRFVEAIAGGAAVLPSAPISVRSNDVEYAYRQDSDFYYLTGFSEPESVAVFAPGHKDGEFVLFVRPRDKERETWTGKRAGVEGAMLEFGADKAYAIEELDRILPRYLENVDSVYYPLGLNQSMNARMIDLMRKCQAIRPRVDASPSALLDPREIIHEMRLFKETAELERMRRAAAISSQAHARAMREARGGVMEWAIEAVIDYTFRSQGAAGPGYPSIVASGPNATILHHITNDRELRQGELLLIDAGCEYDYYTADISRTFPVAARFNQLQRELYSIVLDAQLKAIDSIKPGVRVEDVHDTALRVLVEGMRSMKMIGGSTDEILSARSYGRFYMHRTSHWLGMDVHDVGHYRKGGEPRRLEAGMVLTVEPGIYIGADDDTVPEEMRGIGIRIEDDLLVTSDGHEVLTAAAPKQIADIEALTTG